VRQKKNKRAENILNDEAKASIACELLVLLLRRISRPENISQKLFNLFQGKLFQRCTHFLYCSVLFLDGKVNTRRMSQPDMESIFTKIIYEIFWS